MKPSSPCAYPVLTGPPYDQRGRFRLPGEVEPWYCAPHMLEVLRTREALGLPSLVLLQPKVLRAVCWKRMMGLAGPAAPRAPTAPGVSGRAAIEHALGQEAPATAWRVGMFVGELSDQECERLLAFPAR